jgi:hypothetical protein
MLLWPPVWRLCLPPKFSLFPALLLTFALPIFAQPAPAANTGPAQLGGIPGEYTDAAEPDTPLSFYVKDGKLYVESERQVPEALTTISATEFSLPEDHVRFRFSLAATGTTVTVEHGNEAELELRRTGNAEHHVFHPYVRTEEMIPRATA